MNLKNITMGFGVVLLLVGLLGFVMAPDGLLLGIFRVDTLHNIVHILTGAAAIAAAMSGGAAMRMFYQIFGVVYALVTVLGFLTGQALAVVIPVNGADNVLHILLTAFLLYYGFVYKEGSGAKA